MTIAEQRIKVERKLRRQLHKRLAWITHDNGITMRECHVLDVSSGGVRIATDDAMDVRDRFELTLVPGHHKRERCEVVWRRGRTYGVKFLTVPPEVTPPLSDAAPANDQTAASGPPS
jgi:PilZ domain-containing protein